MPTDPRPEWVLIRRQQIGHRIALLRAARGWSVDDLAAAAKLDRKTVMRAEHATSSVGLDVVLLIAHGLDVRPGVLLDPASDAEAAGGS